MILTIYAAPSTNRTWTRSFPDATDVMFSAACRAQISQPRVIVTSTHGGVSVQDGLRLMTSADRRHVSVVGVDQWGAMADVMRMVSEYGHRSVLYFAGPKEWRDAATRLLAWNKLCGANAISSVTVQCESWGCHGSVRQNESCA